MPPIVASPDGKQTTLKINVGPLQGQQFRDSHARECINQQHRSVWFVESFEYLLDLRGLKSNLGSDRHFVRKSHAEDGIRIDVIPLRCGRKRPTQGCSDMMRNGCCISFRLRMDEYSHIWCVDAAESVVGEFGHQMLVQNVPV